MLVLQEPARPVTPQAASLSGSPLIIHVWLSVLQAHSRITVAAKASLLFISQNVLLAAQSVMALPPPALNARMASTFQVISADVSLSDIRVQCGLLHLLSHP